MKNPFVFPKLLVLGGISIVLVVAVASLINGSKAQVDNESAQYTKTALQSSNVENVEKIPMYPGALKIEYSPQPPKVKRTKVSYDTTDSSGDVRSFYDQLLVNAGWVQDDGLTNELIKGGDYHWNSKTSLPFTLTVAIDILTLPDSIRQLDPASPITTSVRLITQRVPKPSKVPSYPGAHNIRVTEKADPMHGNNPTLETTYMVNAEPNDVEQYYESTLYEHGWEYVANSHTKEQTTLEYSVPAPLPPHYNLRELTISITPKSGGLSSVRIEVAETFMR